MIILGELYLFCMENIEKSLRLESLDVLRGADMFFIMGGAGLFIALSDICPVPFFQAIAAQMYHAEWNGLTHHYFPFIFVYCWYIISFLICETM